MGDESVITHVSSTDRLSRLSPQKRALLERRRKIEAGNGRNAIARRERCDFAVLSFAQQRLWFLNRFDPASGLYNRPVTFRLSGTLDKDALERSLAEIIERH